MDREDWFNLLQDDIKPAARGLADQLHTQLARGIVEGMTDAVNDMAGEVDEAFCMDVLLPAMKRECFVALARLCSKSADGWEEVYRLSCKERWPK